MRTVHGLSDESGTCGGQSPHLTLYKLVQRKMCDVLTPRTNVVNHWCKEHCVINNDVNLKFCWDSAHAGVAHSWGGGGVCILCTVGLMHIHSSLVYPGDPEPGTARNSESHTC